jgi:hypothetical protein
VVPLELKETIVPIMPLAPMVTDHTCVNVKMDSLEMDSLAQVSVSHMLNNASKCKIRLQKSTSNARIHSVAMIVNLIFIYAWKI